MLTKIDVDSENAFFVPILGATPKDSLLVRSVTGLDVPDIDLFIGDYSRDGGIYQGRRVGRRNIVITMDLNPNPALGETISGLREMLYKAFIDPQVEADFIKLALHLDDGRVLATAGYVEKFESEIFGAATAAQISIICPDPYLRDEVEISLSNPSGWLTVPFQYHGTAEAGFEAEIWVTGSTNTLIIDNNSGAGNAVTATDSAYRRGRMILNYNFVAGDVVYVNTVRGQRTVLRTPSSSITADGLSLTDRWAKLKGLGVTTPLVGALTSTSPWIELHSQSNLLRVYGATPTNFPANIPRLEYTQAYWGI